MEELGDLTMAIPELGNAGGVFPPNVPDGGRMKCRTSFLCNFGITVVFPIHKIYSHGGNG